MRAKAPTTLITLLKSINYNKRADGRPSRWAIVLSGMKHRRIDTVYVNNKHEVEQPLFYVFLLAFLVLTHRSDSFTRSWKGVNRGSGK